MAEEKWRAGLEKFIRPWQKRKEVIGAVVTGSHVFGTATKHSDIDVIIVLREDTPWRERGNKIVDGFLFEYFANSIPQIESYQASERAKVKRHDSRMLSLGQIVFDKTGDVKKLQTRARRLMKQAFKNLSKADREIGKYSLWDALDNLESLKQRESSYYAFSHYLLLKQASDLYSRFLGIETSGSAKLDRYFGSPEFARRYGLRPFPDRYFVRLFDNAVKKPSIQSARRLVSYVLDRLGGFEIDGWRLRSKAAHVRRSR